MSSVWRRPRPVLWPDEAFWGGRIPQQHPLLVPWRLRGPRLLQHRGERLNVCVSSVSSDIWSRGLLLGLVPSQLNRTSLNSRCKWRAYCLPPCPADCHTERPTLTHTHSDTPAYVHTQASQTIRGKDWVCFLEGALCVLCSYGWHDIFIGCCHASLLGLVDILEPFLHSSGWATASCIILFQRRRQNQGHILYGVADVPLN